MPLEPGHAPETRSERGAEGGDRGAERAAREAERHHQSDKHPKMSMRNRAAQFSPFAALNGYNEAIKEVE